MTIKPLNCARCNKQFNDADDIVFTGLSNYHEIHKPQAQQAPYAIGRVKVVLCVEHLVCEN